MRTQTAYQQTLSACIISCDFIVYILHTVLVPRTHGPYTQNLHPADNHEYTLYYAHLDTLPHLGIVRLIYCTYIW